jgi:cytochrome c oxidase subunit 3
MAEAHTKKHDYHIIDPSPWPITAAFGAFVITFGGVCFMRYLNGGAVHLFGINFAQPWLFFIGLAVILYVMYGWWSDTVKEAHEGAHTRVVSLHLRYGMIMFIASEVMFFVAWFWAYFDVSLFPNGLPRRPVPAQGHRSPQSLAFADLQHHHPAALGHDGHLGAPRAAAQ